VLSLVCRHMHATKHKTSVYKKYQSPLFTGPGFSPLCGYKMSSFTAFFSDSFRDLDTNSMFDKLTQTARSAQALCNRATAMLLATDPSVAAGTALVPFNQDVQPVINKRTMQTSLAVETATKTCQQHVTHTTASQTQHENVNAALAEKLRLENVQYAFTIEEEKSRHERRLNTLHNQQKTAEVARTSVLKEEDAEAVKHQNVLDSAEEALLKELKVNTKFLTSSGLLRRIDNGPAGGAGAVDDDELEGEIRRPKRGRDDDDDDDTADTVSCKAKLV
jgi:hypothetical protein